MNRNYRFGIMFMLAGAALAQVMQGTITDAVTKRPIHGASITISEIAKTCTTDSAGYYSTGVVPAGIFNAAISAPDYLTASRKVFIAWPKGRGISTIKFSTGLYHVSSAADTTKGMMSLTYQFPGQADIEIAIKNGIGKTIRIMFDRSRTGGMRTVSWNGKDDDGNSVPAGRYQCRISSGRLVLIRTLDWKGNTDVPPPPAPAAVPAAATEAPVKSEATPAQPSAIPEPHPALKEPGANTPEQAPKTPAE